MQCCPLISNKTDVVTGYLDRISVPFLSVCDWKLFSAGAWRAIYAGKISWERDYRIEGIEGELCLQYSINMCALLKVHQNLYDNNNKILNQAAAQRKESGEATLTGFSLVIGKVFQYVRLA